MLDGLRARELLTDDLGDDRFDLLAPLQSKLVGLAEGLPDGGISGQGAFVGLREERAKQGDIVEFVNGEYGFDSRFDRRR